jgi:hypothetical protein
VGSSWVVPVTAADVGTPSSAYQERAARAHALRATGKRIEDIAAELGVCWHSAHAYLKEPSPGGGPGTGS